MLSFGGLGALQHEAAAHLLEGVSRVLLTVVADDVGRQALLKSVQRVQLEVSASPSVALSGGVLLVQGVVLSSARMTDAGLRAAIEAIL